MNIHGDVIVQYHVRKKVLFLTLSYLYFLCVEGTFNES